METSTPEAYLLRYYQSLSDLEGKYPAPAHSGHNVLPTGGEKQLMNIYEVHNPMA